MKYSYFILLTIIVFFAGCASKAFEMTPTRLANCKPTIGFGDERHCFIDTVTPNERTAKCEPHSSNWGYRRNKYVIYWKNNQRASFKPRPAYGGTPCESYNRRGILVEGQYSLMKDLAVVGDICSEQPLLAVHWTETNHLKRRRDYFESGSVPLHSQGELLKNTDPLYELYVNRDFDIYTGPSTVYQKLDAALDIIEKQCGQPAKVVRISGRVIPIEANAGRKMLNRQYRWEEVYKGNILLLDGQYSLLHEDYAAAKKYQELSQKIADAKAARRGAGLAKRSWKRERAQEGLRVLFEFGAGNHGVTCNMDDPTGVIKRYCEAREAYLEQK